MTRPRRALERPSQLRRVGLVALVALGLIVALMVLSTVRAAGSEASPDARAKVDSRASGEATQSQGDQSTPPPPQPPIWRLSVLKVAAQTELTAEAVELYGEAFTDGCRADFLETYGGMIVATLANEDSGDAYMPSVIMPGWVHIYGPSINGCTEGGE